MTPKDPVERSRRRRLTTENQRLPLFMSAARSRVCERVVMSAATSREKQRYLKWAAEVAGLSRDEAEVMMLDRAIGDYMKRDEGWQWEKATRGADEADAADGSAEVPPASQGGRVVPPSNREPAGESIREKPASSAGNAK